MAAESAAIEGLGDLDLTAGGMDAEKSQSSTPLLVK